MVVIYMTHWLARPVRLHQSRFMANDCNGFISLINGITSRARSRGAVKH